MTFCEDAIDNATEAAALAERKEVPEIIEIVDSLEVLPEEAPRTPIRTPQRPQQSSGTKPVVKRRRSFPPLRWDKNGKVRIGKKYRFSPRFVLGAKDLHKMDAFGFPSPGPGEILKIGGRSWSGATWGGDLSEVEEEVQVPEEPRFEEPPLKGPGEVEEQKSEETPVPPSAQYPEEVEGLEFEDPPAVPPIAQEPEEPCEVEESEVEEPELEEPIAQEPEVPCEVEESEVEEPELEEPQEVEEAKVETEKREVGLGSRRFFYVNGLTLQMLNLSNPEKGFHCSHHSCWHVLASEESQTHVAHTCACRLKLCLCFGVLTKGR